MKKLFFILLFPLLSQAQINVTNQSPAFNAGGRPLSSSGNYTFSFDFRSDSGFCRYTQATLYSYGKNTAFIEYPYLHFITDNDEQKILLNGSYGFSKINNGSFHKLTFKVSQTEKQFLIDGFLIARKFIHGNKPINANLFISSDTWNFRLSGAIANISFLPEFVASEIIPQPEGVIDTLDFPPNYIINSGDYSKVPTALEQLNLFKTPNYNSTIDRNFSVYNLRYVAGWKQGISEDSVISNGVAIQTILALKYNWGIRVADNLYGFYSDYTGGARFCFDCAMINLANNFSGITTDFTTVWPQLGRVDGLTPSNKRASNESSGTKYFINDRIINYRIGSTLNSVLKKRTDMRMFENGESGLPANKMYATYTNYYLDSMLSIFYPISKTEYDIHDPSFYSTTNTIPFSDRITISNKGYASPSTFFRYPYNWRLWNGEIRGIGFYLRSKNGEINSGHPVNTPFVSAGWDIKEENNMRPSQYLGLLKIMQVAGVKYFFPSYFTLGSDNTIQNPKGYVWQMVMPSYAQSCISKYYYIILHGELMKGDVWTYYYLTTGQQPTYEYNFWSGSKEIFTVVRKLGNEYLIATAHEKLNNFKFEGKRRVTATIFLNGKYYSFDSRAQGSVYYLNTATGEFTQLDKGHKYGHPLRWN